MDNFSGLSNQKKKKLCNSDKSSTLHTWKMAYIMQVRGRLLEYSETVKMFRPHLFRSSSSLDSSSSLSVLTPNREMLLLESEGPWETFLTPLICVISCCFCCFFFSRVLEVGDGISTSFCLSEGRKFSVLRKVPTLLRKM